MLLNLSFARATRALNSARLYPKPEIYPGRVLHESDRFRTRMLRNQRDYLHIQKLRYDVFHREFRGKKFPFGLDRDRYEDFAEHILVEEKVTRKVIGTYRLIRSNNPAKLYSASEFHIQRFLNQPGIKVELSRACIHKDFRSGAILSMLWKGIAEYIELSGATWLFGIPSVKTTCPKTAAQLYMQFRERGFMADDFAIRPRQTHRLERQGWAEGLEVDPEEAAKDDETAIPPLFYSYIRAGAKIYGTPAVDRDFACIDFFTALHKDSISKRYKKKFLET